MKGADIMSNIEAVKQQVSVVIVGAGQAGLSLSYYLKQRQISHVLLEKHRAGHAWRSQRWDSFCLVTPNYQCRLPGHPYAGDDPNGFMLKDQIVSYLDAYVESFSPPLREGVEVRRVRQLSDGVQARFAVDTSDGRYLADHVVIAAGGYHKPKIPQLAAALPKHVVQLNAATYKNAAMLPEGAVLVVGSGQSGCQIAEDLHLAGRKVHLCTGSAPRVARRYRGRDVVAWLEDLGHYDMPIDEHPDGKAVRRKPNHYVTGRDGGRDIDLRKFAKEGMQLYGRLTHIDESGYRFGADLEQNLDKADATSERIKSMIDEYITRQAIQAPIEARYVPVWTPSPSLATHELAHADSNITTVIWCMGFATDYSFIDLPVFEESGYPKHDRGVTPVPGLSFLGLPWMYTWGSGRFCGVGRDAQYIAEHIAQSRSMTANEAALGCERVGEKAEASTGLSRAVNTQTPSPSSSIASLRAVARSCLRKVASSVVRAMSIPPTHRFTISCALRLPWRSLLGKAARKISSMPCTSCV
jgi:putative flavoprotein involved in K+ transport